MVKSTGVETMPLDYFVNVMEAMRAHYKFSGSSSYHLAGGSSSYHLPSHIAFNAQTEELPNDAIDATKDFQGKITQFNSNQKSELEGKSRQYLQDKDYEDFKRKMEESRTKAKKLAEDNIDAYFDKMIEVGKKHPKARNAIAIVTETVINFFQGLLEKIRTFVLELVDKIVKWLEKVWGEIKNFFENAGKSIATFFNSIFGGGGYLADL